MLTVILRHDKESNLETIRFYHWGECHLETSAIWVFNPIDRKLTRQFNADIPQQLKDCVNANAHLSIHPLNWSKANKQKFSNYIEYSFLLEDALYPILRKFLETSKKPKIDKRVIATKVLAATKRYPTRLKADDGLKNTVTIEYPKNALNAYEAHYDAAKELCLVMGWSTELVGGYHKNAYYWVFIKNN